MYLCIVVVIIINLLYSWSWPHIHMFLLLCIGYLSMGAFYKTQILLPSRLHSYICIHKAQGMYISHVWPTVAEIQVLAI